jgi:hypothetical protein
VQQELLSRGGQRLIPNCTRQWGKSTVTAAKTVQTAYTREGSLTLVISPSVRQSGEFVRKATRFLRALEIRPRLKFPRRTADDDGRILVQAKVFV